MRDHMQDGMAEATRLTSQGRLAEATAAIQRALGGVFAPPEAPYGPAGADEPTEATLREAGKAPQPTVSLQPNSTAEHALRRAPRPPRRFRGMPRTPGVLPGAGRGFTGPAPAPTGVPAGGRFVARSYTGRAGTRAYKLYVPSGYVGQAVPLIVMLHGCTQDPDDFAAGTRMNSLAEEHTFLVAYPAQAANANNSRCWNWFQAADQQRGRGEPSLIAGITREIMGEHNVPDAKAYVAGMSAGGAMAAIMGAAYPDLYAAVGVHSGLAPGAAHDLPSAFAAMRGGSPGVPGTARQDVPANAPAGEPARTVPAIVFHGDRDTTVHPRNADHLLAYYRAAANTTSSRNGAGTSAPSASVRQGQVPGGHAYTRAIHRDAGGRTVAEQWTVHGLGHAWSGGGHPGSYTDPKGPDASAEMVRFFRQQARREPTG